MASAPPFVPGQRMHPLPIDGTVFALAHKDMESATTISGGGTKTTQQRPSSVDARGPQPGVVQKLAAAPQPSMADRKQPFGARYALMSDL